jgi:hypothetical protein
VFVSLEAFAQEDFKIVKVDNSEFPVIEVYIRTDKGINPNDLIVKEKESIKKISADTVPAREVYKGRSVLFILDARISESVVKALSDVLLSLNKSDEINIAIYSETDGKPTLSYLSPEYSNNVVFFLKFLSTAGLLKALETSGDENCRTIRRIEKTMLENADADKNKAVVILDAVMHSSGNECSALLKTWKAPVYFLHLNAGQIPEQKELVDLCTKSGGIFTTCQESETEMYLHNYLEDIKYAKGDPKTNMYRISFETGQKLKKNYCSIEYKNTSKLFIVYRPQKKAFTVREKLMAGISAGLLVALLALILFRRKRPEVTYEINTSNGKKSLGLVLNPIEINVRIKGLNKTYFFEKHIISIGRSSNNDIIIPDRTVSGNHAVINKEGNDYMIQDLGSTNGVVVNQKKVKKVKLQSKDKIKLGAAIVMVRM